MDQDASSLIAPAPSIAAAPPGAQRRQRRLVRRVFAVLLALVVLGVGAATWRLYEEPRLSVQLLVLGLRFRSATLVHATLDTQATLSSVGDELASAESSAPASHSLLGLLQSKLRGFLAGSARGHLAKMGVQVLDAYLEGRTTGDAASTAVWTPLAALFSLDQTKIKTWLGDTGVVAYVGTERSDSPTHPAASPPPPARAAVHYRLTGAGVAPTDVILLCERRGLLWQLVGIANARAVVDAFRAGDAESGDAAEPQGGASAAPGPQGG